jgi:tripartite-type tricarboxylate transporter receptor subunit TctC
MPNSPASVGRRAFLRLVATTLALPAMPRLSRAQAWPARPIRAIVPILAGTGVDVLSRLVLNELSVRLGQPIVVENRPGASGTVGGATAAKADPDGYTLLTDSSSHTIVPSLFTGLPYDPVHAFAAVIPCGTMPFVLVCASEKGFKTLADLIAAANAKPGGLTYASGGLGTTNHLAVERLRLSAGFEAMHVPYRGAGFIADVLADRIDFAVVPLGPYLPLIQTGKLSALAVTDKKRTASLPGVPTTLELGHANSDTRFWVGLFVPARTPDEIIQKLNDETTKALGVPRMRERLAEIAAEPMIMSPSDFGAMIAQEFAANAELAKKIGLKAT